MKNLTKLFALPLVGAFALTLTPANATPPPTPVDSTLSVSVDTSGTAQLVENILTDLAPSPLSDPADQIKREMARIDKVEIEENLKKFEAAKEEQYKAVQAEAARLQVIEDARLKAEAEAAAKAKAEKEAADKIARDKAAAEKEAADKAIREEEAKKAEEARVQQEIDAATSRSKSKKASNSSSKSSGSSRKNSVNTQVAAASTVTGATAASGSAAMRCEVPSGNSLLKPWVSKVRTRINAQFGNHDIGGTRPGDPQDHGKGLALDVMTKGQADGDAIAQWARANAGQLNITYVIWHQKIWSVQRSSEGWRPMSDRGSVSANHYDHVHISFNNGEGSCPA